MCRIGDPGDNVGHPVRMQLWASRSNATLSTIGAPSLLSFPCLYYQSLKVCKRAIAPPHRPIKFRSLRKLESSNLKDIEENLKNSTQTQSFKSKQPELYIVFCHFTSSLDCRTLRWAPLRAIGDTGRGALLTDGGKRVRICEPRARPVWRGLVAVEFPMSMEFENCP